jgi:hypothetical protein
MIVSYDLASMTLLGRRAFLVLAASFASARALPAAAVSLDDFMELSERLLGRRNLDRQIGEIYLRALNRDADTAVTLAYLVQSNGNPTPEQRMLAATIIAWWNGRVYATAAGLSAPWFAGW